jgi:uncharacterized membrane protein YeaQ/YmgE (transglycosylase-associated protein family)
MNEGPVDWGSAILIGGVAGWMANKFMHAHAHLITDIVAGVAGAVLLNAMFEGLGFHYGGWVEFLALGFVGACLLLAPVRWMRVRLRKPRPPNDWGAPWPRMVEAMTSAPVPGTNACSFAIPSTAASSSCVRQGKRLRAWQTGGRCARRPIAMPSPLAAMS